MTTVKLPAMLNYKCDRQYLVVQMENELLFYGVKIDGNCGLNDVYCE
jgi:hypothetical protein